MSNLDDPLVVGAIVGAISAVVTVIVDEYIDLESSREDRVSESSGRSKGKSVRTSSKLSGSKRKLFAIEEAIAPSVETLGVIGEALHLQRRKELVGKVFALSDSFEEEVLMQMFEYLKANKEMAIKFIGYPPRIGRRWIEQNMHMFVSPPTNH